MRTIFGGPLAASLLLLSAFFLPAKAGVLYSLTGVVGDSHWSPADFRKYNQPFGSLQLFADLASVFQANGGPGGLITIDFSGPPLLVNDSHLYYSINSLTASCADASGCVDGNGYVYFPFQSGGPVVGPVPYPIDSSLHAQDLEIPPFAPYQASFEGYTEGYVGYTFLGIVGPDTVGQPFALTVNTIPEPAAWTLLLAGLFGIAIVRSRRSKSNEGAVHGTP